VSYIHLSPFYAYPEENVDREIYRNQTDFTEKGSLLWILDRTKTRFGARLLKTWIGRPLANRDVLQERLDAVEEIFTSQSHILDRLRTLIRKLPDLVKGLCRIQYGKVYIAPRYGMAGHCLVHAL
jgi:DNA mismatch repair protein MSH3